jgi:hypothetical protein
MPTTPIYALPYPAASDPADVPLDMQELAERVEAVFPTVPGLRLIENKTLSADGFPTFSVIPQEFRHLLLIAQLRAQVAAVSVYINLRLNGDTGANYTYGLMGANDATQTNAFSGGQDAIAVGTCPAGSAGAGNFGGLFVLMPGYTAARMHTVLAGSFAAAGTQQSRFGGGLWTVPQAINSLQIYAAGANPNFLTDSRFTLYGAG